MDSSGKRLQELELGVLSPCRAVKWLQQGRQTKLAGQGWRHKALFKFSDPII